MGKVGSGSINHALYNKGIETLHAHWMSGEFPEAEFPTTKLKILNKIKNDEVPPLKVITPIREPLGRNLSAFMYNLIKYGISGRQETVEELYHLFIEKYNIYYPDLWFEKELMSTFNFNPFNKKFNHRKGYQIYNVGKHKILIIRLENADKVLPRAIHKLLRVRGVQMIHHNNFEEKKYVGHKYKELKTKKFSREFLDKIYDLKYAKHFYTEKELEKFKDRYNGTIR
jgi:hypothetical protein